MATRLTPSQLRSKLRQIESKQRQAISKYNQQVRKHNQVIRTAVNAYNNEVRKYNSRVRANRQRIKSELNRLQSRTHVRYSSIRTSSLSLNNAYELLDSRADSISNTDHLSDFLDLSERETIRLD